MALCPCLQFVVLPVTHIHSSCLLPDFIPHLQPNLMFIGTEAFKAQLTQVQEGCVCLASRFLVA